MKRYHVWIKAACSLLFLAFLVWYAGRQDLASVVRRADPLYLALCVLLSPVLVAASTWKWSTVLKQEGHPSPFGALFGGRNSYLRKRELVILIKPTIIRNESSWKDDLVETQQRLLEYDPRRSPAPRQ